jgi:hypothetical protein
MRLQGDRAQRGREGPASVGRREAPEGARPKERRSCGKERARPMLNARHLFRDRFAHPQSFVRARDRHRMAETP